MSLFIASLNSGSNGNCYYIGNEHEAVLIDAGISCRETEKRLLKLGLSIKNIKAVFISHEHSDHIKGLDVLSRKHNLQVYITQPTMLSGGLDLHNTRSFRAYEPEIIGGLCITAFPKSHDAADAHSFIVEYDGVTIGIFTDIGFSCEHVIRNFKKCNAIFLEANYDDELLESGNYPYFLKSRVRSNKGHLSNAQALDLFLTHKPAFMSHVLLSHLSKNNNSPQLAQQLFSQHANGTHVVVASRDYESDLYHITGNEPMTNIVRAAEPEHIQAELF